jgi:aspartyl/asparaginyl beta-hydroxylase (cupin superfamily)
MEAHFKHWLNSKDYYFNETLEKNWLGIKNEALRLIKNEKFVHHGQSDLNLDSKEEKLATDWRKFHIYSFGKPFIDTREIPFTWSLISSIPEIMNCEKSLVYFSLIPGFSSVRRHVSGHAPGTKARHQLCLAMGKDCNINNVFIEVENDKRSWELGKTFSFDDAFNHSVVNASSSPRLVLLYDSIHLG